MDTFVTVKKLADELGMDRSNIRKYVLSKGFAFLKVRTPESRNQLVLALSASDAELIRQARESEGYGVLQPVDTNGGFFYIIQLIPELAPLRVKLGFASDVNARLQAHRTSAPTASLVASWPCKKTWEIAAIASATRTGCKLIANEVYACDDLETLVQRGSDFFSIMPTL